MKMVTFLTIKQQADFGGAIYIEKVQKVYFVFCLDKFSKIQIVHLWKRSNSIKNR